MLELLSLEKPTWCLYLIFRTDLQNFISGYFSLFIKHKCNILVVNFRNSLDYH